MSEQTKEKREKLLTIFDHLGEKDQDRLLDVGEIMAFVVMPPDRDEKKSASA